ncbi:MAG: hypothetical protein ACI9NT_000744 [Bacteroidia bacterium]|jgi:hypothetical protein
MASKLQQNIQPTLQASPKIAPGSNYECSNAVAVRFIRSLPLTDSKEAAG